MTTRYNTNLKQWQIVAKAESANFAIAGTDSGTAFTNLGATGAITGTLPLAAPGLEYRFFVAAAQTLTVAPRSVDAIRGKAAGASYAANTVGFYMKLSCIVLLHWEIEFNIGPFA
jgi:hypothetical protein